MRRRLAAIVTASAVIFGSGLLVAAPAKAASITVSDANCTAGVINGSNFSASTGDVVTITGTFTGCQRLQVGSRLVTSPSDIVATGTGVGTPTFDGFNYALEATSFTSIQITFTNTNSNMAGFGLGAANSGSPSYGTRRTQWGVTYTGSGGGGSSESTTSLSTPSPIFQQFGKPTTGACDAAAPATLNWSGVASGGWGESWAQWMNNGRGGAVCTRTLVYSTNQSKWIVG
jgi:hypothetical protein